MAEQKKIALGDIREWVFDLDDTLYPSTYDIFSKIEKRICEYMNAHIGVSVEEARELQRQYYAKYGVTIRGLMIHHDIDPDDFLEYAHEIDLSVLPKDGRLDKALGRLKGKKFIFTNGAPSHAERVLKRVGIRAHFEDIFSIKEAHFIPKPSLDVYRRMLERFKIDPTRSIMFDDAQKNLKPAHELGMLTVWIKGNVTHFSKVEENPAWCDYTTTDLAEWLDTNVPD